MADDPPAVAISQTVWSPGAVAQGILVTAYTNQAQWSAASDAAWLTVSPATGPGGARMTVMTTANSVSSPRTGTVTVTAGGASAALVVTQGGSAMPPNLTLSRTTWDPDRTAQSTGVVVNSNQQAWSATSNASWLTVAPGSWAANTTMTLFVTANTTTASRTGTVTVTTAGVSATVTVTQEAEAPSCLSFEEACPWDLTPRVVTTEGDETHYLRFTAPSSAWYVFESSARAADSYPLATLHSPSLSAIAEDLGGAGGWEFRIIAELTAGQVYYLTTKQYFESQGGHFTITAQAFSAPPFLAFASAGDWDLSPIVVSPIGSTMQYLRFTAPVSGWYEFESSNHAATADPAANLYAADLSWIAYDDDSAGGLNFRITAELTGGQVYYLVVRQWAAERTYGAFTVTGQGPHTGPPPLE